MSNTHITVTHAVLVEDMQFTLVELRRARATLRLTRDLELNAAGTALVLDLLDEIEVLRSRLSGLDGHSTSHSRTPAQCEHFPVGAMRVSFPGRGGALNAHAVQPRQPRRLIADLAW